MVDNVCSNYNPILFLKDEFLKIPYVLFYLNSIACLKLKSHFSNFSLINNSYVNFPTSIFLFLFTDNDFFASYKFYEKYGGRNPGTLRKTKISKTWIKFAVVIHLITFDDYITHLCDPFQT